ncbi:MAG: hypothetical protein ACO1QB_09050 [Verrucomicrobiales bacterium]
MNLHSVIALTFAGLGVLSLGTGCGSTRYSPRPIVQTTSDYAEPWREKRAWYNFRYDAVINPYTYNPSAARDPEHDKKIQDRSESYYSLAITEAEPSERARYRNLLQNAMISVSKESTEKHIGELKASDDTGNVLLGGAAIGTAGAASVASQATASALAAASSGLGGARGLYNEQYFRNTVMEALVAAIHADREVFLKEIEEKQSESIKVYDVEAAIRDAIEYHRRGSFTHGLTLIRRAVETERTTNLSN